MDLLYPYIPKWVQSANALRSYDVIKTCRTWKSRIFAKNRRKLKKKKNPNFAMKVLNIRISPGFWLLQKENCNSNMFCKFQQHSMQIFSKMDKRHLPKMHTQVVTMNWNRFRNNFRIRFGIYYKRCELSHCHCTKKATGTILKLVSPYLSLYHCIVSCEEDLWSWCK